MTGPATWSGEGVTVGDVLRALDDLRRGAERFATRTSVVTLIAIAHRPEEVKRATDVVHWLGGRHPARVVVIHADADAPAGIDAAVAVDESEGGRLWSEDVVLRVGGAGADHLSSLVEPLTLPDLPVVVWYVASAPSSGDELVSGCHALIVDSKALSGDAAARLLEVARVRTVIDLSWVRLRPWRELLAGLFDGPAFVPFATAVRSATVEGKDGPRQLLAGWLTSRLGLARAQMHLVPARPAAMRLVAERDGRRAEFEVGRATGETAVRARAVVDNGPAHEEVFSLPDASTSRALIDALGHLDRDRIYEDALVATLGFRP